MRCERYAAGGCNSVLERMGPEDAWAELYTDLPSDVAKVKVAGRSHPLTITAAAASAALQTTGRNGCHGSARNNVAGPVRPSGAEDAVRVYVEANSQKGGRCSLASEAMMIVSKICGRGVGAPPQPLVTNRL